MNLREAKEELNKAQSGPYGKHWVYGQAVRVLIDELEKAEAALNAQQMNRQHRTEGDTEHHALLESADYKVTVGHTYDELPEDAEAVRDVIAGL